MTYQPTPKARRFKPPRKALWWQLKFGDKPSRRTMRWVRPQSRRRAKLSRLYAPKAEAWKAGRGCCCAGLRDDQGRLICHAQSHACEHVHHSRGRIGSLLMDQRFWLPVCGRAHRWVGDNVAQARARGLLCQPGEWNTPFPAEAA